MQEIWFIEKDGRRRRGKKVICACGTEFIARINSTRKSCSSVCGSLARRKLIVVECAKCFRQFEKHPSDISAVKSGFHFCSRKCKDEAQKIGGIKEIMPAHYGTGKTRGSGRARRFLESLDNPVCEGCGECRKYFLIVHHKDGDFLNNEKENFEVVCANCHIKRHLKLVDGVWIYCTSALTPRHLLSIL